jgi:hypothetical protein
MSLCKSGSWLHRDQNTKGTHNQDNSSNASRLQLLPKKQDISSLKASFDSHDDKNTPHQILHPSPNPIHANTSIQQLRSHKRFSIYLADTGFVSSPKPDTVWSLKLEECGGVRILGWHFRSGRGWLVRDQIRFEMLAKGFRCFTLRVDLSTKGQW